jgi:putative membrane protein
MRTSRARRREDLALAAGIGVLIACLGPWFDRLADRSFAWHMLQHVCIMLVAAPLLLLGAPLRRILVALPLRAARDVARLLRTPVLEALGSPVVSWVTFTLVLYVTHFSPLYELALEREPVHAFEHGLFLTAALMFWNPVLGVAPSRALPYPVRIFYIFMAMPASAFLALAIYTASHPMYPYYLAELGRRKALIDQAYGGEIMWLLGGVVFFIAFMALGAQWLRDEERKTLIADRRELI